MSWASEAIAEAECHGTLTIDGISMNCATWAVLNNFIWWQPATVRGEDNLIPGETGVLPNRRRRTASIITLNFLLIGTCDVDGDPVPAAEWQSQLAINNEWLDTNVFTPPTSLEGTREAVLTLPDGYTRTGDIHILNITYGVQAAPAITMTIDVSIPAGQLGPRVAPGS